jgi:predicted HicB family RNase H-like nuclease
MTHDLLIRGFDDQIHSQLGELAKEKGVSINSIVIRYSKKTLSFNLF